MGNPSQYQQFQAFSRCLYLDRLRSSVKAVVYGQLDRDSLGKWTNAKVVVAIVLGEYLGGLAIHGRDHRIELSLPKSQSLTRLQVANLHQGCHVGSDRSTAQAQTTRPLLSIRLLELPRATFSSCQKAKNTDSYHNLDPQRPL